MRHKSLASAFDAMLVECPPVLEIVRVTGIPLLTFKQIFYAGAGVAIEVLDASGREALIRELDQAIGEDAQTIYGDGTKDGN
jgi:hypothetical protein